MTGRSSRSKGQRGERELCSLIRTTLGIDVHRGAQSRGGSEQADVVGLPGYHIECKFQEKWNVHDWMKQSESDAKPDEVPLVVCRRSREPWYVMLRLEDFFRMVKVGGET